MSTQTSPTMPFGKFKGRPLSLVPCGNLCIYANWAEIFPETKDQILQELASRGLRFGKYKGVPLSQVPPDYLRWLNSQVRWDGEVGLLPPWNEVVEGQLAGRF